MKNPILGKVVTDTVSGFTGTVTAVASYITGPDRACVVPKVTDPAKAPEEFWFDVERLNPAD